MTQPSPARRPRNRIVPAVIILVILLLVPATSGPLITLTLRAAGFVAGVALFAFAIGVRRR